MLWSFSNKTDQRKGQKLWHILIHKNPLVIESLSPVMEPASTHVSHSTTLTSEEGLGEKTQMWPQQQEADLWMPYTLQPPCTNPTSSSEALPLGRMSPSVHAILPPKISCHHIRLGTT